jgi:hypothetical protein
LLLIQYLLLPILMTASFIALVFIGEPAGEQVTVAGSRHAPNRHELVPLQTVPHVPQFCPSLNTALQTPLHGIWFVGHWHTPLTQVAPVAQTLPQVPQFAPSRARSTQLAPQATSGTAQLAAHLPRVQTCPSAHAFPQPPQLLGSSVTSTHLPPHDVVPARQVQVPAAQTESLPQALPQVPQFASSESSATQVPAQSV